MGAAVVALALPLTSSGAAKPARTASTAHQPGRCPAVRAPRHAPPDGSGVTVVVGASIAEGYHTTGGERTAWPHLLGERLRHEDAPGTIVNDSVNAARLLADTTGHPCTSALHREDQALAVPGVRTLVLTDLINDIQQTPHVHDPRTITDGLKAFVARAHARGVRVVAGTISPYGGFVSYEPAGERTRRAVNDFIRHSGLFDGVIDFDAIVADPGNPSRMRPAYDSGDHLHPNDAGQRAITQGIPLDVLQ
ncbi:GDSL-type esterase/lipase family protein [Streptomyces humicola]|nr:GDSL-type esterase/lipase family protein [Streptomyces humicola]